MIPNHPNWSAITSIAAYPKPPTSAPEVTTEVSVTKYGPLELSDSTKGMLKRWWYVYQDITTGNVIIEKDLNGSWTSPFILFNEPKEISQIDLTFDQLGRPTVFYNVEGQLKLFWYDSQAADQVLTDLVRGSSPTLLFDYPLNPSNPSSDMIMFYVNEANEMDMRYQRDRWGVVYPTGVSGTGLRIHEADIDRRNRLQVIYDFRAKKA